MVLLPLSKGEYNHRVMSLKNAVDIYKRFEKTKIGHFSATFIFPIILTGLTVFLRYRLNLSGMGDNYLLIYFVIIICALLGNMFSGVFATILGIFTLEYFFFPPYHEIFFVRNHAFQLSIFFLQGIFFSWIIVSQKESSISSTEQRDWFMNVMGNIDDGIIVTDRKGIISYMNSTAENLSGLELKEAIGKNIRTAVEFLDSKNNKKTNINNLYRKQVSNDFSSNMILNKKSKEGIPIDYLISDLKSGYKKNELRIIVLRDITERRKVYEKLREDEEKLKRLTSSSVIGVYVADLRRGIILEANDVFLKMLRYSRKEFEKRKLTFFDITPEEFKNTTRNALEEIKVKGMVNPYEKEYLKKNGDKIPVLIGASVLDKRKQTAIAFVLDLTEHKKSESYSSRLASIVESTDDPIISKDLRAIVTSWNRGAEKLYGFREEEMLGKPIIKIFPKSRIKELDYIMKTLSSGEALENFQTKRVTKKGKIIDVSLTISPVFNKFGDIVEISVITRDISKQLELERQKDEFVAVASHELKTPLTTIKGYEQILKREVSKFQNPRMNLIMENMEVSINKLNRLVGDLLEVSRIQLSRAKFASLRFDFDKMVDEIIESVQAGEKKHKIIRRGRVDYKFIGDKFRFEQVLSNLLNNAIKYSPESDRVIVDTKKENNKIKISIIDYGIGVNETQRERIFERFYRSENASQKFSGMGIGLFISSEIVKRYNGTIEVGNNPDGKGSIFTVILPLRK